MMYIFGVLLLVIITACNPPTIAPSTISPSDSEDHQVILPDTLTPTSTMEETEVLSTPTIAPPTPTDMYLAPARIAIHPDSDIDIKPEDSLSGPWVISGPVDASDFEYWVIQDLSSDPQDEIAYRYSGWSAQFGEYLPASSPENGLVAFLTGEDSSGRDKELIVYDLPNDQELLRISLFAPWHQLSLEELDGSQFWGGEICVALKSSGAFMWSPDSRYLAFTAVIDGPSSDVYLFDTQSLEVERLTDGTTQAFLLGWSPDGKWLLHSAGSGGRLTWDSTPIPYIHSIWAIAIDTMEVHHVEEIDWVSEGEDIIGWSSNDTVLVSSWELLDALGTNSFAVRELDLGTQSSRKVFDGPFDDVAYDPSSDTLAFVAGNFVTAFSGVHLLPGGQTTATQISDASWEGINWVPEFNLFMAFWGTEDLLWFDFEGNLEQPFSMEKISNYHFSTDGTMALIDGTDPSGIDCSCLLSLLDQDFVACLEYRSYGYYREEPTISWDPDSKYLWIIDGNQVLLYLIDSDEFFYVTDLNLDIHHLTYRGLIFE
jgi:WD40 repeat protein